MIRLIFVLVAGAIGITAVTAQTDPISARKALMKKNSQHTKAVNGMIKGTTPYDQAAVNAAFAKASAAKPTDLEGLKKAFPAVNKTCGDCHEGYRAAAKKK